MKKIIVTLNSAIMAMSMGVANADDVTGTNTNTNTNTTSSGSTANNGGVSSTNDNLNTSGSLAGNNFNQKFDSHNVSNGSDLSRMVPAAVAPALTTTLTETCMGSTSAGVSWAGAGISFGTTWRDSACVRRLDAREVKTLRVPGANWASKEIMCDSGQVREAFLRAGFPCVEDGGVTKVAAVAPVIVPKTIAPAPIRSHVNKKLDRIFEKEMAK